ncbi:MAG TPA: hypothetical protein VEZ89_13085 [Rubrivivax sp.]|nr:hypothetical protein [Rubrivivax sp.]
MHTEHLYRELGATQYAQLVDAAKADAVTLRRAAIDGFWHQVALRIQRALAMSLHRQPAPASSGRRASATCPTSG